MAVVEDAVPEEDVTEERGAKLYAIVGGLMLVMLMAALDSTIVSTALPTIVGDLGGLEHISWVVTAYLLAQTVVTPLYGKLGDLYGRKLVLQIGLVIFVIGSALCGQASSMTELILFRGIQGLGGGGLMVSAQASIGDVVSPRERGKYSGLFGGVFGVATVVGPLLGGFLTSALSWHWIFYVNLPIGLLAFIVLQRTLPAHTARVKHTIDYLGTALLAVALTALVLLTTLGGDQYAWTSPTILGLGVLAVAAIGGFVLAEHRAVEPVLPNALWRNRVFAVTSAMGFIVGFALFGATTYLPLFQQVVRGLTPTESGLALLPLMGGVLVASIGSGFIIARKGRYKVFPIVGSALLVIGLALFTQVSAETSTLILSLEMVVVGLGLGCIMQVLILAVQNAVPYEQLGVATSGATLFRTIGGSLGTAILGAIFAAQLSGNLARDLPAGAGAGGAASGQVDPAKVGALPETVRVPFLQAYTDAMDTVFVVAAIIAVVAFVLAWFIEERPLRETVTTSGVGEAFAVPRTADSLRQIGISLSKLVGADRTRQFIEHVAQDAGVALRPATCWMLGRYEHDPSTTFDELRDRQPVPVEILEAGRRELLEHGYVTEEEDGTTALTPAGVAVLDQLRARARARLERLLDGWEPEQYPELERLLTRLAGDYAEAPPKAGSAA
jgi:EmrB/QacA subfamily drug resistance transporter